jgi:hypothetical protein
MMDNPPPADRAATPHLKGTKSQLSQTDNSITPYTLRPGPAVEALAKMKALSTCLVLLTVAISSVAAQGNPLS